jgi:hypothetical protein
MTRYDDSFLPPAPVARVALCAIDGQQTVEDVPMLMDTGADMSLVPIAAASFLGIPPDPSLALPLEAFDGTRSEGHLVELDLIFCDYRFRGRYVLTNAVRGLLGRDVLNHLRILLDGPRRGWSHAAETP